MLSQDNDWTGNKHCTPKGVPNQLAQHLYKHSTSIGVLEQRITEDRLDTHEQSSAKLPRHR